MAGVNHGNNRYNKWHLGEMLCSEILNLQMFRKVFLATPNDILAKYHSLRSSNRKSLWSFARCSGLLRMTSWQYALLSNRRHAHLQQAVYWDFRRRWVWEGSGWRTLHHEEKGSPPSLLDHFHCCFPHWSLSSFFISSCLLFSTRTCLWSLGRCSGLLQMTFWKNAMLSNRLDPHVQQAMRWDFHGWPW